MIWKHLIFIIDWHELLNDRPGILVEDSGYGFDSTKFKITNTHFKSSSEVIEELKQVQFDKDQLDSLIDDLLDKRVIEIVD